MDTVIIGCPLTGKTVRDIRDRIKINGQKYNLLAFEDIPICYCHESVLFRSAFRELFWVYAKIPWAFGKLFIGGVANGDKMEWDKPFIEMYTPRPFMPRLFTPIHQDYIIHARPEIHRYELQRFIIDGTVFLFYSLESLSMSDIIHLLVRNFIKVCK